MSIYFSYREIYNYFKHYTSFLEYEILMIILTVISSIAFKKITIILLISLEE